MVIRSKVTRENEIGAGLIKVFSRSEHMLQYRKLAVQGLGFRVGGGGWA